MAREPQTDPQPLSPDELPEGAVSAAERRTRQIEDIAARSRQVRDEEARQLAQDLPAIDQDDPNRPYVGLDNPFATEPEGQEASAEEPPAEAPQAPAAAPESGEQPTEQPETPAEEPAATEGEPPVADPDAVIEYVINGQTQWMTVAEAQRNAQKLLWANQYMEQAKQAQDQLRRHGLDPTQIAQLLEQRSQQPQPTPAGETPAPAEPATSQTPGAVVTPESLGIDFDRLLEALNYGDADTSKEQLQSAFSAVANAAVQRAMQGHQLPSTDELTSQIAQRVAYTQRVNDAFRTVNEKYGDAFGPTGTPDAKALADVRYRQIADQARIEGRTFDVQAALIQAADEAASVLNIQPVQASSGVPPTPQPNPIEERQQQKRNMDQPPPAATGRMPTNPQTTQQQQPMTQVDRHRAARDEIAAARHAQVVPQY